MTWQGKLTSGDVRGGIMFDAPDSYFHLSLSPSLLQSLTPLIGTGQTVEIMGNVMRWSQGDIPTIEVEGWSLVE